jgi:excinuclease UvrABC ATPase subunit
MLPPGFIGVRGARQHNLKDVSLDIPKRQLPVFTGVSGAGKSSLVFGTVAAESQRLLNEAYAAFVQSFMPSHGRPDVDSLTDLSAAILVDQSRMGANSRSTVGTATDGCEPVTPWAPSSWAGVPSNTTRVGLSSPGRSG